MGFKNGDILLTDSGDLRVEDGDFAVGEGDMDDIYLICQINPGAFKSDPVIGVGLIYEMNKPLNEDELKRLIQLHLKRDNKVVSKIGMLPDGFGIDI